VPQRRSAGRWADTFDAYYGAKLFIDAPPPTVLGVAVTTSSVGAVNHIFCSTITGQLIEAPVLEKDRAEQGLDAATGENLVQRQR